jgi:hypothetical protein
MDATEGVAVNLVIVGSRRHRALVQPYRWVRDAPDGGVDVVAEIAARQRGLPCIIHLCGKGVHPIVRNTWIERDSDECDAFPDGEARGTGRTIGLFNKAGKPIRVHEPGEPSLLLFTAQIWYAKARLPHAFDITRGSGGEAGDPFAPPQALLDVALPWLKREPQSAWDWYAPRYWAAMNASRRENSAAWHSALAKAALVGCCYCAGRERCHRGLWVRFMVAAGKAIGRVVYDGGEVPRFS